MLQDISPTDSESSGEEDDNENSQQSYQFEYHLKPLSQSDMEHPRYDFEYEFQNRTISHQIFEKIKTFISSWIGDLNSMKLNRKESVIIFNLVNGLIGEFSDALIGLLGDSHNGMTCTQLVNTMKDLVQSEFSLYNTDYKFNKTVCSNSSYVHPEERVVGTRYELKRDKNTNISVPRLIQSTLQYVSIVKTLESLFRDEEFRKIYFEYNSEKHTCEDGFYKDFCCGNVYKQNSLFTNNRFALQIQLITDDFEPCSPLQSKAGVHKLTAVYFSLRNIPMRLQSKLSNIHLVCLGYSYDINKSMYGDFNHIWRLVMEDLNVLETEGISIGALKLKGSLVLLLSDNLGANYSLGYARSFSAGYWCRFCECNSKECGELIDEIESKNRTVENYSNRVKVIGSLEVIDYSKTHGVRTYCALNDSKYFHITKNIAVDILHDLYEGVMPFVLLKLFKFMTFAEIATQPEINDLIHYYDYGDLNQRNLPSLINFEKNHLGQNGAQMKCLFLHIPFILAKFKQNEKVYAKWQCIESLLRISQIIHSTELSAVDLNVLKSEVINHLSSIKQNFNVHLAPKHHNLIHYVRTIKSMGPVIHMNMIRYESKHKTFKEIIHRSPNFQNVCKTLAIRHQQHAVMSAANYHDIISAGRKFFLHENDFDEEMNLIRPNQDNESIFETEYFCCNGFK